MPFVNRDINLCKNIKINNKNRLKLLFNIIIIIILITNTNQKLLNILFITDIHLNPIHLTESYEDCFNKDNI